MVVIVPAISITEEPVEAANRVKVAISIIVFALDLSFLSFSLNWPCPLAQQILMTARLTGEYRLISISEWHVFLDNVI